MMIFVNNITKSGIYCWHINKFEAILLPDYLPFVLTFQHRREYYIYSSNLLLILCKVGSTSGQNGIQVKNVVFLVRSSAQIKSDALAYLPPIVSVNCLNDSSLAFISSIRSGTDVQVIVTKCRGCIKVFTISHLFLPFRYRKFRLFSLFHSILKQSLFFRKQKGLLSSSQIWEPQPLVQSHDEQRFLLSLLLIRDGNRIKLLHFLRWNIYHSVVIEEIKCNKKTVRSHNSFRRAFV